MYAIRGLGSEILRQNRFICLPLVDFGPGTAAVIQKHFPTLTVSTNNDKAGIDETIRQFFGIFNNVSKQASDWNLLFSICIPETIIVKKERDAQLTYNLSSFIEPRKKILTDGTLTGFEEGETSEEAVIVQNIAQRHSQYKKCGWLNGQYFSGKGTKFFHLVKTPEGWKISAIVWEDDLQ